eukprot:3726892-Pyramimonas_sp.AAC.1
MLRGWPVAECLQCPHKLAFLPGNHSRVVKLRNEHDCAIPSEQQSMMHNMYNDHLEMKTVVNKFIAGLGQMDVVGVPTVKSARHIFGTHVVIGVLGLLPFGYVQGLLITYMKFLCEKVEQNHDAVFPTRRSCGNFEFKLLGKIYR